MKTPQIAALPGMSPLGLPITETARHTPGPWSADEQVIFASSGEAIASTWKFGQLDTGGRGSHAEADANARLIAAAPFLLQTLQTIALHAPSLDAAGIREYCDAAIAKAGGR